MKNIIPSIKRNWPYAIMLLFVVMVNLNVFTPPKTDTAADGKAGQTLKIEPFDKQTADDRRKKIAELYYTDPGLYFLLYVVNMAILIVILSGVLADVVVIYRKRQGRGLLNRTLPEMSAAWGMADVIKFALMFYSFGYLFIITEGIMIKRLPAMGNRNLLVILNATVTDTAGILLVLYFVVFKYREKIASIGLTTRHFLRNVGYGIAAYLSVIPALLLSLVATAVVMSLFKVSAPVQPIVNMLVNEKNVPVLVYSSVFAAVMGPVMEEIFFRGFFYNALKKRSGALWGMIATSVVFSLLHAHPVGFVPIFILGMLLVYVYEQTGSLVASMTVHILHNLASVGLVLMMKNIYALG